MKQGFLKLVLAATFSLAAPYTIAVDNMEVPATSKKQQAKKTAGKGTVVSTDEKKGIAVLKHEPMPDLGWPAMTMRFKVEDKASLKGLNKGDQIEFSLQTEGDDYLITEIKLPVGRSGKD